MKLTGVVSSEPKATIETPGSCVVVRVGNMARLLDDGCSGLPDLRPMAVASCECGDMASDPQDRIGRIGTPYRDGGTGETLYRPCFRCGTVDMHPAPTTYAEKMDAICTALIGRTTQEVDEWIDTYVDDYVSGWAK